MTLATHLVGRASELDSVDRLLTQVDEGHSAALELVGEPGIGKTRLLAETGRPCRRTGVPRPFGPGR